jgi:hypothetical protein
MVCSMIPTTVLDGGSSSGTCVYEIHSDGPDGPLMKYANVGDKSYHVWQCSMNDTTDFQILVHECVASDESSRKMVPIVDLKG